MERLTDDQLLAQYFAERDVPCPVCGYNLRSVQSRACPECGNELSLTLVGTQPRFGWWFTAMFGASIAAGPTIIPFVIALLSEPRYASKIVIPVVSVAAQVILLEELYTRRIVFTRRNRLVQCLLAVSAILLAAVISMVALVFPLGIAK